MVSSVDWAWEKLDTSPAWVSEEVRQGGNVSLPFKRYGHSVVVYQDKVYLWGGRNDQSVCNTLFCFDPRTRRWSVPDLKSQSTKPPACDGHSACVIGNMMYVFGGFEDSAQQFSQELYAYDFDENAWRYIRTSTEILPPQRDFHSAVAIGEDMYIFGGRSDESAPYYTGRDVYHPELYRFNTRLKEWTLVTPYHPRRKPVSPRGRRSLSAFEYNGNLYITCGYNGIEKKHYNDFFMFNVAGNYWVELKPKGSGPAPRRRMSSCVLDNRVFFFGGTSPRTRPDAGSESSEEEHGEVELRGLENHGDIFILDMCKFYCRWPIF
ncbi:unnamed protein product [Notodromas monacha]|uniref:Kelch domain containing 3 n=1 Tax=Notodromas monacha TaxID=399045 RepID=A0A7R9GGW5_9CRUS|nr:unnamed protein product [Notodromas monacha]CAG0922278.1 unnamed protein product [Notodromas monacha]